MERRKICLICTVLFLAIIFTAGPCMLAYGQEPVYKALNPRGTGHDVKLFPITPRLTDFNGKTVYVISQHVGDADIFLKKVAQELPKYLPGVKAVYKDKPAVYMTDDPDLWKETTQNAHAFIYGAAA